MRIVRDEPTNQIPSLIAALAFMVTGGACAEIRIATDAPKPLSPEESKKHFRLPGGFRIDLIAGEPLIADPSYVAWDEHGRLFVTEIHGYNLEGHLDVPELNKTGKLDTTVRRIHVDPTMKAKAREGQYGSLKLLRDGDGRMDEANYLGGRYPGGIRRGCCARWSDRDCRTAYLLFCRQGWRRQTG